MVSLIPKRLTSFVSCFALAVILNGCTEVRTIFAVLFSGGESLSTSAFEVDDMKSGSLVTCSILRDKSVRCLGSGAKGSLGRFYGGPVSSLSDVKQVALGKGFTCAIVGEKGEIYCFGNNDKGQLGNPNFKSSTEPVRVLDSENKKEPVVDAKSITAGENHACALLKTGKAICWGDNSFGQAGNPSQVGVGTKSVIEPDKDAKPFQEIKEIAAGGNSTCIIAKAEFIVYCFGERYKAVRKINWLPEQIELGGSIGTLIQVKQIGLGRNFGCALGKNSQVYCWGANELNQLGALVSMSGMTKATAVQVTYPQQAPIAKVDEIAVGEFHACALHRDEKTVYCWGDNRYGQLGNTSIRGLPEQVALGSNNLTLKGVKDVAVGPDRTCIISSRDEVFCWGNGAHGILGSEKVSSPYPVRVLDANGEVLSGANQIIVGYDHSCIIDSGQKLYCFGLNQYGQLGSKIVAGPVIGADIKPVKRVTAIETYGYRTCMVYGDDQGVACFGDKEIDNINQKYEFNSFIPEEIKKGMTPYKGVMAVSVGRAHVCVVTSEEQVECLGDSTKGQLGDGEGQNVKYSIVKDTNKNNLKDVWQVKSRGDWNCALKQESGSIWCWGTWSATSDRWAYAKQINVQGKPSADFIQMTMSEDQICGVHGIDHSVYCSSMGEKNAEKIDLQPLTDTEGHALKKILVLTGGAHHSCGLDEEGRVYCWGSNEFGQLGTRAVKDTNKAIRVLFNSQNLKKISRISAGDTHTCVSSDEQPSLFCFGQNFFNGANATEPVEYPL